MKWTLGHTFFTWPWHSYDNLLNKTKSAPIVSPYRFHPWQPIFKRFFFNFAFQILSKYFWYCKLTFFTSIGTTNFPSCATKAWNVHFGLAMEVESIPPQFFWSAPNFSVKRQQFCFAARRNSSSGEGLWIPTYLGRVCLELITYKISNKVILHLIDRLGQLLRYLFSLSGRRLKRLRMCTVWPALECSRALKMRDGLSLSKKVLLPCLTTIQPGSFNFNFYWLT